VIYISKKCQTLEFWLSQQTSNSIKLDIDKYVTTGIVVLNVYCTFCLILTCTCLFLQLSVYPTSHMTLSHSMPCNHPSLCYATDPLYPLPDASDLPHSETRVFLHFRK